MQLGEVILERIIDSGDQVRIESCSLIRRGYQFRVEQCFGLGQLGEQFV